MSPTNKYSLQNYNNFDNTLNSNISDILSKYILLINDFLKHFYDNIYIQKLEYKVFIVKKGINTISHIFKLLLLYTKDLDIVFHNTQKSYIYFVEFIEQISEDNNTFLQLNSKDASLFIYKKTIFDINNDIRKNLNTDNNTIFNIDTINTFINIYNNLVFTILDNYSLIESIKYINTELSIFSNKIIKLIIENNNSDLHNDLHNKLTAIQIFSKNLKDIHNIFNYSDIFIKKIKKKQNINLLKLELELINIDSISIKFINNIINTI